MVEVTAGQYDLIVKLFSFTVMVMVGGAIFFFSKKSAVLPRYQTSVICLGIVAVIAAYSYYQILQSWQAAFKVVNGVVVRTGIPFDESYRWIDWLIAVPLLLISLILVLDLPARQERLRCIILSLLSVEMIILGYPGSIATEAETRWVWLGVGMVPFLLIIYQLYISLASSVNSQPDSAKALVTGARFVTVGTWSMYPILFVLPLIGVVGTNAFVGTQISYAFADMFSKAFYGVLICAIATAKTEALIAPPEKDARTASARVHETARQAV